MDKIQNIPIEKIVPGGHALRENITSESVNDLTSSIARIGIVCPLIVEPKDKDFVLIAGHRRYFAARLVKLKEVPCIIKTDSQQVIKEVSFAENFFRANITPVEQAAAIKDIIDTGAMTVEQLAKGFNRSGHWIEAQVNLLNWPDDILNAIHKGWLSCAAASNLALITDDTYRGFLLRNAEDSGVTARITAAWLQAWRAQAPPEQAIEAPPLEPGRSLVPAVPQAPCICCNEVNRQDALSMVMICSGCIAAMRNPQLR